MWLILLTIVHIIVAVILIGVVLLQTGKRADLAGAFGGGGSQTVFGTRGAATLLSKITTGAAIAFMLTSLGLSLMASRSAGPSGGSVLPDEPAASTAPAPSPSSAPVAPPSAPPTPASP
jgi:preprotein translocase subunit SecG